MKMKRTLAMILAVLMAASLASCAKNNGDDETTSEVETTFSEITTEEESSTEAETTTEEETTEAETTTVPETTTEKVTEKETTTKKPEEKTTKKPEEKTTKKPEEKTTKKAEEKTTKKPEEKTTKKAEEKTTKKEESTTKKPAETTTKKQESSSVSLSSVKGKVLSNAGVSGANDLNSGAISSLYGISSSDMKQAAGFMIIGGAFPEEGVMIEANDSSAASRVAAALQNRLDDVKSQSANYDADSFAVVKKCKVVKSGNFVGLFLTKTHTSMENTFTNSVY